MGGVIVTRWKCYFWEKGVTMIGDKGNWRHLIPNRRAIIGKHTRELLDEKSKLYSNLTLITFLGVPVYKTWKSRNWDVMINTLEEQEQNRLAQ